MKMELILYTGTKCPKCPAARKVVREVAKELNWVEGKEFVEKIIDGKDIEPGTMDLDGESYNLVKGAEEIGDNLPAALVGEDFTIEALMFQIASTPSIVIKEEAVFVGEVPTKEQLLEEIKKRE
jgi:hypothetical protein